MRNALQTRSRRGVQLIGFVLDLNGDLAESISVLAAVMGAEQELAGVRTTRTNACAPQRSQRSALVNGFVVTVLTLSYNHAYRLFMSSKRALSLPA